MNLDERTTTVESLEPYRRAQDVFDTVVAAVPADRWDAPSACAQWSVRDVVGHVTWAQLQLRAWATGAADPDPAGAPGAPNPGSLAGDDPVAAWRGARAAAAPTLTEAALARPTTITGIGEVPLAAMLPLLMTDTMTHAWDVGHALDLAVELPADLVERAFEWSRANMVRQPGFFGPELTAPEDADDTTRLLAYLGRAAWLPVPV